MSGLAGFFLKTWPRLPIPAQVRGSRFAAVLDEALRRAVPDPPVATSGAWARWSSAPVISPFLSTRPLAAAAPRWMAVGIPPARRLAHRLTTEQRRAFERLGVLGADLPAGFTGEELRREYRRLAWRFHPDRHGDCSALEREQRAGNFAEAAASYSCLRALVETRH